MKFELDESVRVKTSGKVGVVKSYRQTLVIQKNIRKETKEYLIGGNDFPFSTWFNEEGLDYIHKFDNKFEAGLIDLLIDVNLLMKNYDLVKELSDQKKLYK